MQRSKRSLRPSLFRSSAALLPLAATLGLALAGLALWLLLGGAALAAPTTPALPLTPLDGTPAPSPTPLIAVPTIGVGASSPIAPVAPSMTGVAIATTLTCVTALAGLVIAVGALSVLLREGYGPFLRALLLGSRARRKPGKQGAGADEGLWDASHTLNYRPGPDALDDPFAPQRGRATRRVSDDSPYDAPERSRRGSSTRRGDRGERGDRGNSRVRSGGAGGSGDLGRRAPSSSRRGDW